MRRACAQDGFTLIEILASAFIIIVIAAALAQGLITGAHLSGYEQNRSQGDEVAQQDQERLRGLSAKQLSDLAAPETYSATVGRTIYTVTSQATLLSTSGSTSCTTAGAGAVAYYRTVSTVSWKDVSGTHSVSADSIITPPVGGNLLTAVQDETNSPLSGVTVSAAGTTAPADNESGITDTNGCLILAGLQPDTYNMSLTDPGFVDFNGNSTLTDSASVTGNGTARPANAPEVMGQAGSIGATFSTGGYATDTATTTTTITGQYVTDMSFMGAGSTETMSSYKTLNPGTTYGVNALTAANLFPFAFLGPPVSYTNNYRVWAGGCLQEEPPSGYDTASVNPGSTQSMTVQEPALNVSVSFNGSPLVSPVAPAHVKVAFASTSGTTCTDTWNETVRAAPSGSKIGVLANPGVPFASTATSGATASASGQTGTLSVCADYKSGSTSYKSTVTGVTATDFSAPTAVSVSIPKTTGAQGTC